MRKVILALVILAIPASTMAALTWYTSKPAWDAARAAGGWTTLYGSENYEECTLGPGAVIAVNDPLTFGVPNVNFPLGLTGLNNLSVQSNTLAGNPAQPSPRGLNTFVDSIDHIFAKPTVNALGFYTTSFLGGNSVDVRAYDAAQVLLGQTARPADPTGANFLGVISDTPIGRLNVFDTGNGAEGIDNIDVYVPEPATLAMLSLALLALRRR